MVWASLWDACKMPKGRTPKCLRTKGLFCAEPGNAGFYNKRNFRNSCKIYQRLGLSRAPFDTSSPFLGSCGLLDEGMAIYRGPLRLKLFLCPSSETENRKTKT